jgi:hypothetical protein
VTSPVAEISPRPEYALSAPADYEARALDLAIEALSDIAECDKAKVGLKWDRIFPDEKPGSDGVSQTRSDLVGIVAPILYVYFCGAHANLAALPRVFFENGRTYPAHAICLLGMRTRTLMHGQKIKDTVRKGVEGFLRLHNVTPTSIVSNKPFPNAS